MLNITREGGHTPYEFDTLSRRRMRFPNRGDAVSVDPNDMPMGVLRNLLNDRSFKVDGETDEAKKLIEQARKKVFRPPSNALPTRPLVRDEFTAAREKEILEDAARRASAVAVTDPTAPPPGTGATPEGNAEEREREPEQPQYDPSHPIARLLEKAPTMEWNELRRVSKELLRDDYPSGSIGREDVVAALQAKLKKGD